MIKIHKIFLKNFKGVHLAKVVDFSGGTLTILDGPNGFGKTTIFDAIEICLRGKLERTVSYDHVTKKNADHKKPFYQNVKGEDVMLKLWLQDDVSGADHIICKFLGRDHDGKIGTSKAFRPDAWSILSTYYSNTSNEFETKDDVDGLELVEQSFLDKLIFGNSDLSLVNLYPLFNYLQQEENIYFLKKDEEKKKNELDFLFQTQQDARKLEKIDAFIKNLRSCKQEVSNRLINLGDISKSNSELQYNKLFPTKSLLFDTEDIFKEVTPENLVPTYERVRNELDEVILFKETFDADEFLKLKFKESLSAVRADRRLQTAFVLHLLFEETHLEKFKEIKSKINSYNGWAKKLIESTLSDEDVLAMNFDEAFLKVMRELMLKKTELESQIGQLGKIIVELNSSRETVTADYIQLDLLSKQPSNCPLCNSEFQSLELLMSAIDGKTDLLRSINESQVILLEKINKEVKDNIIDPISERISTFFKQPENKLELEVYDLINQHIGLKEVVERFNLVLSNNQVNLSRFQAGNSLSLIEVNTIIDGLEIELRKLIDDILIAEEKIIGRRLYKDLFDEKKELLENLSISNLTDKREFLTQEFLNAKFTSAFILEQRFKSFEKIEIKVNKVRDILDKAIKKYKMEMVDKIKIPFYIFSGKIIQNYQQGFGIFIDMNEKTNRVRFLADCNSDHDIIHHLSSGQLAVVSIAFCLALNKVYSTTNNFKFLAIDDPVQTLDDINVHSFIELMRHDFKNYQILLSTHEENVASYMDYKFKKFGFNSQRQRVQKLFYTDVE